MTSTISKDNVDAIQIPLMTDNQNLTFMVSHVCNTLYMPLSALYILVPEVLLFFLTMGKGAKKKCAAAARAAKKAKMTAAKAKTPVEAPASASTDHTPSDTPTQSNTRNSKKTGTAPCVLSTPSSAQPVPTH